MKATRTNTSPNDYKLDRYFYAQEGDPRLLDPKSCIESLKSFPGDFLFWEDLMKRKFIIEIETKSKNDFGIFFMSSILEMVVKMLNGYRKCYFCSMKEFNG